MDFIIIVAILQEKDRRAEVPPSDAVAQLLPYLD
jgi:hypothetical protein